MATAVSKTVISLRWTNTASASSINLQYSLDEVHYYSLGAVSGQATTCTVGGAQARTTYYFRLQAVSSKGLTSPYSNVAKVTTP